MASVAPIRPVQQTAGDDGVRELHGVLIGDTRVTAYEKDGMIYLEVGSSKAWMPPKKIRYLARKLYRLARRIEQRELV